MNFNFSRKMRVATSFGILILLIFASLLIIYISGSIYSLWQDFQHIPTVLLVSILVLISLVLFAGAYLVKKLLFSNETNSAKTTPASISEQDILQRIDTITATGLDTHKALKEISRLKQRRESGLIHIAMFGEVNMGKSSIIKSLLPEARIFMSCVAGTTTKVNQYQWTSKAGDKLILVDVPGTNQISDLEFCSLSREEAKRAHIIIYVCDGDLNRSQYEELQKLDEMIKPIIIALNKSDRYSTNDLSQIQNKIATKVTKNVEFVTVSCEREEHIVKILANGGEQVSSRLVPADNSDLSTAIQRTIDTHSETLDQLRDASVFSLVHSQLDIIEKEQQTIEAEIAVNQYTKKAIVGALAAVSPGTDIVVQAYLGTSMVNTICEIYKIPVKKFDIETLLKLVQNQVGNNIPIILTITGNGLKAFPGVGTLAGGLVHATAYGLIFNALGKALIETLSHREEFRPALTARIFQDSLNDTIEKNTTEIIKLAIASKKAQSSNTDTQSFV